MNKYIKNQEEKKRRREEEKFQMIG